MSKGAEFTTFFCTKTWDDKKCKSFESFLVGNWRIFLEDLFVWKNRVLIPTSHPYDPS